MHAMAWAAWAGMVMTLALTSTNPLYLGLIFLCVVLVATLIPRDERQANGIRALALFGGFMLLISLGIAVVNGSYGEHILFNVPGPAIPAWLGGLRLGGPVAAEGLAAAGVRGLAILCVFLAFAVLNAAVTPQRLLRSAPAALFHAGLVVTIGLALLPASIEDLRRVREMRALRGAPGGWRELPALVVPAILGGLERSMRLAEAMEARGFAATAADPRQRWYAAAGAAALVAGAGVWYYYPAARALALLLVALGLAGLVSWAILGARAQRATRHRPERLMARDRAAVALSAAVVAAAVAGPALGWLDFGYNPFAGLVWPTFAPVEAVVVLVSAWPAARLLAQGEAPRPSRDPAGVPVVAPQ